MSKKRYPRLFGILPFLGMLFLGGCKWTLIDSKGQVGIDERNLIYIATGLMLLVVIPVIVMAIAFAWKYRASNKEATYTPEWAHSTKIEMVVWGIPAADHHRAGLRDLRVDSSPGPLPSAGFRAQAGHHPGRGAGLEMVVHLSRAGHCHWSTKIVFPANVPVNFRITSDSVMNSFFIPQLGGQIYAMAGMQTQLHLIANENGEFDGISANYSGAGFTGMKFKAVATTQADFDAWVSEVKSAPKQLDAATYEALAKPSERKPGRAVFLVLFQTCSKPSSTSMKA